MTGLSGKHSVKQYEREFGFTLPDRDIIVDDVRVRGIGRSLKGLETTVDQQLKEAKPRDVASNKLYRTSEVYLNPPPPPPPLFQSIWEACRLMYGRIWKGKLKPGDVIVSNHPEFGDTHLPDITVITPAFSRDEIIFYVASCTHHADIGGILPGSMPPNSKELFQEGAAINSEILVSEGEFTRNASQKYLIVVERDVWQTI
ncbi:hypothetical protein VTN77DRAFT_2455 [Rasamsonia byssochlamydoides]|uniref:uncharacterized protein n=1 Tax=Rasamsonia byssochlamydoides TaxID=89139 RepID=UPI0037447F8C